MPETETKLSETSEPQGRSALPDPATLTAYKEVDPELLKMIVRALEMEQRQRHWRERAPEWTARLGVICGLMIGIAGLVAACYIGAIGAPVSGMALGTADLLGLVSVFVYGSRQRSVPRGRLSSNSGRKPKALPQEVAPPATAGTTATT